MKVIYFGLLYLLPLSLFAQERCALFEISGRVKIDTTGAKLLLAEKTMSEKELSIKTEVEPRFAPYLDRYISGTFLVTDSKILAVEKIQDEVFDPLNRGENSTFKKIRDEQCPK